MADYKGSSVADLSSLRKALSESSAKFKIAKNDVFVSYWFDNRQYKYIPQ